LGGTGKSSIIGNFGSTGKEFASLIILESTVSTGSLTVLLVIIFDDEFQLSQIGIACCNLLVCVCLVDVFSMFRCDIAGELAVCS